MESLHKTFSQRIEESKRERKIVRTFYQREFIKRAISAKCVKSECIDQTVYSDSWH